MSKPGQNKEFVYAFNALSPAQQSFAGGKGGALAQLYRAGYPVPGGFVILPTAFDDDMLKPEAWTQVQTHLERLRSRDRQIAFAVRSSAMSEDAAQASFAGEFETVLDVHTDDRIREAIHTVRRSRHAERVRAYSEAKGLDTAHDMAVVVQQLIRAEMSGVLFTADPVTGSRTRMMGNFVHGLGDQLVSGEATGEMFSLGRREGLWSRVDYQGPPLLEPFSRQLYALGSRLEKELGCPQDTEWCIAGGRLYLLQSRPITTLREYDPITYDWNSSFTGDYLWVTQEVHPKVMTPSTWSFWQKIMRTMKIAGVPGIGNIGGRLYVNYSVMYSTSLKFKRRVEELDVFVGHPPANVDIPIISIQTLRLFLDMIPVIAKTLPKVIRLRKVWKQVLDKAPERCQNLYQQIQGAQQRDVLIALWHERVFPLFEELLYLQDTINDEYMMPYASLKAELIDLVGEDEAQTMLSTLSSGSGQLASIGPLVGLDRMMRGEMSREQYTELYGHRHANENELSVPRPCETSNWLDKRLAEFEQDPVDVPEMQRRRAAESDALWAELEARYSEKATSLKQKADQVLQVMHRREAVRSELTRSVGVARAFFLRAGQLTGLGDDVFFLTCQELLGRLSGEDTPAAATIPARRESYEKYKALPDYPAWVRGRFDPVQWAAGPYRRHDYFDSHASVQSMEEASDTIQGVAGSAGRVEGMVRLLSGPQAGDQLRKGEILVAATTNVGWTPLFSRAAGVITDIGAPLSHAAIVARELGIPAVVGCGNATMQLKTGDRVLMDGGRGTVRILRQER
jgi:phosphohistidine swiveling domain-containing protein